MKIAKLIKLLENTGKEDVELELCFTSGGVLYFEDIEVKESSEVAILSVNEIDDDE